MVMHASISVAPLHSRTYARAPHLQFAREYLYSKYKLERKEGREGMRGRERNGVGLRAGQQLQNVSPEIDELELSASTESHRTYNRESIMGRETLHWRRSS